MSSLITHLSQNNDTDAPNPEIKIPTPSLKRANGTDFLFRQRIVEMLEPPSDVCWDHLRIG
jgi:hypothetical protein